MLGAVLVSLAFGCASDPRPLQLGLGEKAFAAQQYDVALRDADSVVRMDAPSWQAEAHYLRGIAIEDRPKTDSASATRDLNLARSDYVMALSQNPSPAVESRLHAMLGNVAYFEDDYSTALREWTLANGELDQPDWKSWILFRMGICQQRLGRFADADQTFARVQQLYPNTEPAQRAAGRQGVHGFYVQLGAFAQAADAEKAAAAVVALGSVPTKIIQGNLTVIRTMGVPTFAQATSLRGRLSGQYPDARVGP
jgi:Flp pilus assembly protein TadD